MPQVVFPGHSGRFIGGVEDTVPGVANTLQTIDFSTMLGWPADGKGGRGIIIMPSATLRFRFAPWRISQGAPAAVANTSAALNAADATYPLAILGTGEAAQFWLPDDFTDGFKGLTYKCSGTSGVIHVSVFR